MYHTFTVYHTIVKRSCFFAFHEYDMATSKDNKISTLHHQQFHNSVVLKETSRLVQFDDSTNSICVAKYCFTSYWQDQY